MTKDELIQELVERNKGKKYHIFQNGYKSVIAFVNTALLLSGGINIYIIPEINIDESKIEELSNIAFARKITAYFKLFGRDSILENQIIENNLFLYDVYETEKGDVINIGAIKDNEMIYVPLDNEAIDEYTNLLINKEFDKMTAIFINQKTRELQVLANPYKIKQLNSFYELENFIKNAEFDISDVLYKIIVWRLFITTWKICSIKSS